MSQKYIDDQFLVIFGASGDLTQRKLIPSLYNLYLKGYFKNQFAIIGVGRTDYSDEDFREKVAINNEFLKGEDGDQIRQFSRLLYYQPMQTDKFEEYNLLSDKLQNINASINNCIFYLSTPPKLYESISHNLSESGLTDEANGWRRIIIEKPFGYNLETAQKLNESLHQCYRENQIFRIDHYLGKETVQNIMVSRFANSIFEPLWNRNYIQRIEITAAESVGIEQRGGYYDQSGALRDMVQNHLLQLLALVAMEPPSKIDADTIRNEKVKLLESLRPMSAEEIKTNVIRGQYGEASYKGEAMAAYRKESNVNPDSRTETYVALKCHIDNWRWAGVPFLIRTGKRLPTRVSEVVIHFKDNHLQLFDKDDQQNSHNELIFRIQPNEGILLKFGLKIPGSGFNVERVNMDFQYDNLVDRYVPDAYERLLLDCMKGDATLFARGDSTEAAWAFIDPIIKAWNENPDLPLYGYPAGTWGPEQANNLIDNGHEWRNPCKNLTNDGNFCEL